MTGMNGYVLGTTSGEKFFPMRHYRFAIPAVARCMWLSITRSRSDREAGLDFEVRTAP